MEHGYGLEDVVREENARAGPLTFARFMALALYHPTLGYYAGGGEGREPLGWGGDYFTSGDLSPLWGWALARQFHQMWELLGRPPRFDVIEPGAGRGLLAREVWRYAREAAPEWGDALRYTLVDRATPGSPLHAARRERLAADLAGLGVPEGAVRWAGSLADMADPENEPQRTRRTQRGEREASEDGVWNSRRGHRDGGRVGGRDAASMLSSLPSSSVSSASSAVKLRRPVVGCVVSNELVDALPVHVVEARGGALAEVYVDVDAATGRLAERLGPPSAPEVAGYLDAYGIPWRGYGDGWRAEVCLAALDWMREAASALGRGFVLTIDYGDAARRLYTRERRRGTLAVYARHRLGDDALARPGRRDLTAHVNFSALARAGRAAGLRAAGFTTQAAFLDALGIRAEAEARGRRRYPAADTERHTDRGQADLLRRRMLAGAIAPLLDPRGLGGFRALVQQRAAPGAGRALLGLRGAPPRRL